MEAGGRMYGTDWLRVQLPANSASGHPALGLVLQLNSPSVEALRGVLILDYVESGTSAVRCVVHARRARHGSRGA